MLCAVVAALRCRARRALIALGLAHAACAGYVIPSRAIPIEEALQGHDAQVSSIAFNHDGTLLASGSFDHSVVLWDTSGRRPIGNRLSTGSYVMSVAFSPEGTLLAAGSGDGAISVWDVNTQERVADPAPKHAKEVTGVAFSPDGRILASGSTDRMVTLWDVRTWLPLEPTLPRQSKGVRKVLFTPKGDVLAVVTDDRVVFWDVSRGRLLEPRLERSRLATDFPFEDAAFSPGGSRIATALAGMLLIWDTETGALIGDSGQPQLAKYANTVAFSPAGDILAVGCQEDLLFWDVRKNELVGQRMRGHGEGPPSGKINSVAFSPDGSIVASAGGTAYHSASIILWDVETQRPIGSR